MLRERGALRGCAPGARSDENAPPDAAPSSTLAPTEPAGAAARLALHPIQPAALVARRKSDFTAAAPSKGPVWSAKNGSRIKGSKAAARVSLPALARAARKPASRSGSVTAGMSSAAEGQCLKIQDEKQNLLSASRQNDSHAPGRTEDHSDDTFISNSEDMSKLQLEFDIFEMVLVEEMTAHAEAANLSIFEACRQKETAERELNHQRWVTEALESKQSTLINELNELKNKIFKMNEVYGEVEVETAKVIMSLTEDLSLQQQSRQSLEELQLENIQLNDRLLEAMRKKDCSSESKAYAEEKYRAYVRMLERSTEDLQTTIMALEEEVDIIKTEAKQQKSLVKELELELTNARQQKLTMSSSGKARCSLENGMVGSAHSVRQYELLDLQENGKILQNKAFGKESEVVEYFANASELYGSCALGESSSQPVPEYESEPVSEEQVLPLALEPVVEVMKESELPPVNPVKDRIPVDYTKAPVDELKRIRNRNHYAEQRTATDRRFWSIEQQDLYTLIYNKAKLVDMKWVDWGHVDSIEQFSGVRERCAHLGLQYIMSYCCDWDSELIRQFYSTVYISADKTSMTWMADGRRITTNKRAWEEMFNIPAGVHNEIHSQLFLDKSSLCTAADQDSDLSPLASITTRILKMTIYPRSRKNSHNWNILYHILKQHPFDIIALIFGEIDLLMRDLSRPKDLLYAPYIMGMILRAFKFVGPRESKHHSYKPRNYKPKQSKQVGPSAPEAPVVAPPLAAAPLEPEVAADGHDAYVEAANDLTQFGAAGHQPVPSFVCPTSPARPLAP